jgi:hypothetical protein
MIDPNKERLISFQDASKESTRRRGGKKIHLSTWYRWTTRGCKGIRLESLQYGGTRVTSREAIARFFQRLTDAPVELPRPTPTRRRRAAEAAERELQEEGI